MLATALSIVQFIRRHWQLAGVLILLLLLGVSYVHGLRIERSLAQCQAQNAGLASALERQNDAIRRMQQEGEAARQRQQEALAAAERQNEAERSARERLIRASRQPQGPGCSTPPELREMENGL